MMQIAIADTTGKVSLWCDYNGMDEDGFIHFSVINGGWEGKFKDNTVYVNRYGTESPGILVWAGQAKFNRYYYNKAILWIQEQIDDPDYVMTQPDQYVVPVRIKKDEDEWDDVPF